MLISTALFSQHKVELESGTYCSVDGAQIVDDVYEFNSSEEARTIIHNMVEKIGLKPNFKIAAANVPNAVATTAGTHRVIYYNEVWIQKLKNDSKSDWSATFVLAHELAHHLNGHTLDKLGSRPPIELEADEFAGFILYKLGANLTETLAGIQLLPVAGSTTHPPRSAREQAAIVGWNKAKEQNTQTNTGEDVSETGQGGTKEENTPDAQDSGTGDLCISVDRWTLGTTYAITITSTTNASYTETLRLGRGDSSCLYDIPVGVYQISTKSDLGMNDPKYQVRVSSGQTTNKHIKVTL